MAEKNRNFRSSYYDKVGFRGVEEKKSLEILINEKPMDRTKLSKFCLRFTLPSIYRELVWKVLLDVVPVNTQSHEYVEKVHRTMYVDLKQTLEITRRIDDTTPKSVVHTLMYLMMQDVPLFQLLKELETLHGKNLIAIASFFLKLCSCEITGYWLFKMFMIHQKAFNINLKSLKEQLEVILKKNDAVLYEHLKQMNTFDVLPLDVWFGRYFVDILYHTSLVRVFDKVIGGCCKILPYIGSALLIIVKRPLLTLDSSDKIIEVLEKVPEETSDVIVSKAFDLYYS